jgi:hypothetical protein
MSKQRNYEGGQGLVEVALMLLLVSVITGGVLVVLGPQIGGVFSEAHAAISGVIAPAADTPVALPTPTATATSTPSPATPTPTPTLPPLPIVGTPVAVPTVSTPPPTTTPTPTPVLTTTSEVQCPSFSFGGWLILMDGNRDGFSETLIFGSAYVNNTDPYGLDDPLVGKRGYMTWHFVRLGPIRLTGSYNESSDGSEFEVDSAPVPLQIAPLGETPVLVGQVSFKQLWVSDQKASLNREQAVNVSGIQVQNDHGSKVLDAFEGQDQGVLVITFQSGSPLANQILKGQRVYTLVSATMWPAVCRESGALHLPKV